jgi:hypothetical protein
MICESPYIQGWSLGYASSEKWPFDINIGVSSDINKRFLPGKKSLFLTQKIN